MTEKKENKVTILIIVLLILIVCLELFHLIKLHEISIHSQLTNFALYGNDLHKGLRHETERLKGELNNIRNDFKKKKAMPANIKNGNKIVKSTKYDKEQQVFILEVFVPKNLKKEDVGLELNNNILGITYSGFIQINYENTQTEDFVSIYKSFEIPQTKATINDVKYDVNNGILTVIVPITK